MPASFIAANNEYINLGINQAYLKNCTGYTISAWVYITNLSVERDIVAISVGAAASTATSRASLVVTPSGQVMMISRASDADVEHNCYGAAGAIVVNTWYHILGITDLVAATQVVFVNGVQSGQTSAVTFNQAVTSNTNAYNSCIGSQDNGSANMMSGKIHDVRIYNRELSLQEISTIYTSGGKDGIIYGLEGHFLLSEETSGATLTTAINTGTVRTSGTGVNTPTYSTGIIEIQ